MYGDKFLKFIGLDEEIEEILNTEIITPSKRKIHVDFLCLLKNGKLRHVEFQFPHANDNDLVRFYGYNSNAELKYEKIAETSVVNFTSRKYKYEKVLIGESKSFHPHIFYMGDIDFENYFKNINKKVKSKEKLTDFEEIALLLICLVPENTDKLKSFREVLKILENKELFDAIKLEVMKNIIVNEAENLLSKNEQKILKEEFKMSPETENIFKQAIHEVILKTKTEAEEEGFKKGVKKIAKKIKNHYTPEELSKITGLTLEEIKEL